MLTYDKPKSAKIIANYFEDKGYYQKGTWAGRGASLLGLSGEITDYQEFKNVVNNRMPNGMGQIKERFFDSNNSRAGIDLTFCAPKGVSLMALVKGDKNIEEIHHRAAQKVLDYLENNYAQTRVRIDGIQTPVDTGNLVIAKFVHPESRDLDPHLHTHAVIMNSTHFNGKWYSLLNDRFIYNIPTLSRLYHQELASGLNALGYELDYRGNGQFDIAGFSEENIEFFSKRRQTILNGAGKNATDFERDNYQEYSRKGKKDITLPELQTAWREEWQKLGAVFPQPRNQPIPQDKLDDELLNDAISHWASQKASFSHENLLKFICDSGKVFDINQLEKKINSNTELRNVSIDSAKLYTTETALMQEFSIISQMRQGKEQYKPIYSKGIDSLDKYLKGQYTQGQLDAIRLALTSKDFAVAWNGVAGAGKTFALSKVKEVTELQGLNLRGFAPSAEAAKVLGDELNIETNTVAGLLCSKPNPNPKGNEIWIIDEAGLLGLKSTYDLFHRAKQENARLILVGDTRQLSPIEAGNPFKCLIETGIATAHLEESLRQKNPELKMAVRLLERGEIDNGIERLIMDGRIHEIRDKDKKIERIANDYLNLPIPEQSDTLILVGTNAERKQITEAIKKKRRDLRKQQGLKELKSAYIKRLKRVFLTYTQTKRLEYLKKGQYIKPRLDYKKRNLDKDKYYKVVDIDISNQKVTLEDNQGNVWETDYKFEKEIYDLDPITIEEKDRLRWTRNDKNKGRRNGQVFTVEAIEDNTVTIKYDDGRLDEFNLDSQQVLDDALTTTTFSSQGKTCSTVLISGDKTISTQSFYVALSRAKHNAKVYTLDIEQLKQSARNTRENQNPREALFSAIEAKAKQEALRAAIEVKAKQEVKFEAQPLVEKREYIPPKQEEEKFSPVADAFINHQEIIRQKREKAISERINEQKRLKKQINFISAKFGQFLQKSQEWFSEKVNPPQNIPSQGIFIEKEDIERLSLKEIDLSAETLYALDAFWPKGNVSFEFQTGGRLLWDEVTGNVYLNPLAKLTNKDFNQFKQINLFKEENSFSFKGFGQKSQTIKHLKPAKAKLEINRDFGIKYTLRGVEGGNFIKSNINDPDYQTHISQKDKVPRANTRNKSLEKFANFVKEYIKLRGEDISATASGCKLVLGEYEFFLDNDSSLYIFRYSSHPYRKGLNLEINDFCKSDFYEVFISNSSQNYLSAKELIFRQTNGQIESRYDALDVEFLKEISNELSRRFLILQERIKTQSRARQIQVKKRKPTPVAHYSQEKNRAMQKVIEDIISSLPRKEQFEGFTIDNFSFRVNNDSIMVWTRGDNQLLIKNGLVKYNHLLEDEIERIKLIHQRIIEQISLAVKKRAESKKANVITKKEKSLGGFEYD